MSPRMRPASTRKSTPSSATVVPKALRRPRASMHAMASALLLCSLRRRRATRTALRSGSIHEFFRLQTEPLNSCSDPRPFFGEKLLAFGLEQQIARTGFDEHAKTPPTFDQLLVDQFLVSLENGERIDPLLGRDIAHRRQRIAFLEDPVEYHDDDTIPKLAVNWLTIVPLTIHPVFKVRGIALIDHRASYSDIVNYNTSSHASFFSIFLCPQFPPPARLCRRIPAREGNGSDGTDLESAMANLTSHYFNTQAT